jgi:hypothetical protein
MEQKIFEFSKINEGWGIAFVLNPQYFMLELIWYQLVINFKDYA